MPAVDDPLGLAASLPGQLAALKSQVKDLSVNRTQSPASLTVGAGGLVVIGTSALAAVTAGAVNASSLIVGGYTVVQTIAASLAPQAGQTTAGGFTLTTGYANIANFYFTVPSGCTRVLINANGSVTSNTNAAGGGDGYYSLIQINGVSGPENYVVGNGALAVPCNSAQNLSGLTVGTNITIVLLGHLTTGPGNSTFSRAILSATALFMP